MTVIKEKKEAGCFGFLFLKVASAFPHNLSMSKGCTERLWTPKKTLMQNVQERRRGGEKKKALHSDMRQIFSSSESQLTKKVTTGS